MAAESAAPSSKFPEVQGGGSLILAWQIKGKNVLVVGGGEDQRPVLYGLRSRIWSKV